jgi:heterodisulfide reductase subunit A
MPASTPGKPAASALVLGAGAAGAAAALGLHRAGLTVHLAEADAMIGGRAADMGCKAGAACVRCNVCVAVDRLKAVWQDRGIRLYRRARLAALAPGREGSRFTATLRQEPSWVSRDACVACGACLSVCPVQALAVRRPAVSGGVPVLDPARCIRSRGEACTLCQDACPVKAIDLAETARDASVSVDAVVVATGFEPFDATVNAAWGYGTVPNVISGWDAERQLAETRRLTRPSDGQPPKRLAFLQCIGSRSDEIHRSPFESGYCSTVCCAYALRMARRVKHARPETAVTVFYMDLQAVGKDADAFARETRKELTLVRARPYEIRPASGGGVSVMYEDQTALKNAAAEFDLAVLSVGMRPGPGNERLAELLGVPLDEYGFFGHKGVRGLTETWKPGIFVAGAAESPMDLAGAMASAEAVCAAIV